MAISYDPFSCLTSVAVFDISTQMSVVLTLLVYLNPTLHCGRSSVCTKHSSRPLPVALPDNYATVARPVPFL